METFGAKPNKPLDACREEVQKCDALIVIVGHRYGWVPAEEDGGDGLRSITWWEVGWALDAHKPVYAFLLEPNAAWNGEREQDQLLTATSDDAAVQVGRAVRQLVDFREYLGSHTTYELFTSADDLAGKVATSLHDWLLEQAVRAARAAYSESESPKLPAVSSEARLANATTSGGDLYWREQVHLLSAQRLSGEAAGVRVALIGGKADERHPALVGASLKQFDVRATSRRSDSDQADDFTTGLAALLVGAETPNLSRGVAFGADLLVLQVFDETSFAETTDVLAALHVAFTEGAQVVCLPLSGESKSVAEAELYSDLAALGVVVVCPAGNDGASSPAFPAAYPDCVCAGASDARGYLAAFSNRGAGITTTAPGVGVSIAVGRDRYSTQTGTAVSCAIVAGTAALMLRQNAALRPSSVREILRSVGDDLRESPSLPTPSPLKLLNAYDAVAKSRDPIGPDPGDGPRPEASKEQIIRTRMTRGALQELLAKFAKANPKYRRALINDPKGTIEKQLNTTLGSVTVKALVDTADTVHVVIPYRAASVELSNADLERVAGGKQDITANCLVLGGAAVNDTVMQLNL